MYKCSYTLDKEEKERTDDKCLWWRSNIFYKLDSSVDCHLLTERYSIWWMMSQQQYNACTHNLLCLLTERLDDIQIAQRIDICVPSCHRSDQRQYSVLTHIWKKKKNLFLSLLRHNSRYNGVDTHVAVCIHTDFNRIL